MSSFRPILKEGNPLLRKKSRPVSLPLTQEDRETLQNMLDYLAYASDPNNDERPGVGLAAPQIGINKRLITLYFLEESEEEGTQPLVETFAFANPIIVSHSVQKAYLKSGEGCLSVDEDRPGYVERYAFVTVEAFDMVSNQTVRLKFRGYRAMVIQHEIDHLDGILYVDRLNKKDPYQVSEGAIGL